MVVEAEVVRRWGDSGQQRRRWKNGDGGSGADNQEFTPCINTRDREMIRATLRVANWTQWLGFWDSGGRMILMLDGSG
jgi:hypothetical protein